MSGLTKITGLDGKTMLIGVGAQKSGTTWLHRQLQRHPAIYMSSPKELHHFDTLYAPLIGRRFLNARLGEFNALGLSLVDNGACAAYREEAYSLYRLTCDRVAYLDYFRARVSGSHRVFGEFSPAYATVDRTGFAEMRDCHDDVRLIFIMRNPVDRLLSVAKMRAGRAGRPLASGDVAALLNSELDIARSRYDVTLKNIDYTFKDKNVFVGFYENIGTPKFLDALRLFISVEDLVLDSEERLHVSPASIDIDREVRGHVRSHLKGVYAYCQDRFGSSLPELWSRDTPV